MSDPSSYSSLWQHIVLAETQNAREINLFAQYDLSPANNLHEYIGFVEDYISKFSTQSLRNISLLINDFSLKTIEIKSIKKSENHRLKGNAFYQKKLHNNAIIEYRTALQQAPPDSQEISLIYANLSAVYLQEKRYQSCLNAIQYALENNYPSSKRNKLYQRIETLLKESGCAAKFPESPTLSELKSFVRTISLNKNDVNVVYPDCDIKYGPHKEILNFSSACRLNYTCEKGRYIVIDDDFAHGDIVLVEDPYAWLLLKPYRSRYCYGCLVELESPIPCTGCVEALYCSADCMKKSWTSFHQYECKFMFLLNCIGVAHLCFKIILLAGLDKVKYAVNTLEVSQGPIIPEKGYHSVWSLVDNWTKYSNESLFEYGLTAWLVVQILIAGGFVSIDDKEEKDSLMVAALHHLLQLQCNAHAITTITEEHDEENYSNVDSVCQVRIATAIYPSASLLNHSCEPSVINSFHGTQLILRIQKTLKSQDELFNCYGPHYLRHDWQQRRSNLWEQYFFECQCSHCISMDSAAAWLTAYVCSNCASQLEKSDTFRCSSCGQEQTVSDLERIVHRGDQLWNDAFRSGNADLARLTECYNIRRSLLHPHNRILTRTADTLAQHLWRAAADSHSPDDFMHRSLSLSESILKSVAVVFGGRSVEWAWEAIKLAEMIRIVPDSREDRAKDLCRQSFHVFKLNFGEFIAKSIFIKRKLNDFL